MGFNVIVDIGLRFMSLFREMVLMIILQMYLFLHSQLTEYQLIYYKQYAFQIWWTLDILLLIILYLLLLVLALAMLKTACSLLPSIRLIEP